MSSRLRAFRRLVQLFAAIGLVLVTIVPTIGIASLFGSVRRYRMVQFATPIACRLFAISIGLRVSIVGMRSTAARVFVGNHVSYLDILVAAIGAAGVFVSRHDVQSWPVIGFFARIAGTVFLDRTSLKSAIVGADDLIERGRSGIRMVLFPEGRTTAGDTLGPFHPFLFKRVADSQFAVQPFVIQYHAIGNNRLSRKNRDLVYWYDPAPAFASHGWRMLGLPCVRVVLRFLPPIDSPAGSDTDSVRAWVASIRETIAIEIPALGD